MLLTEVIQLLQSVPFRLGHAITFKDATFTVKL